MGGRFLGTPLFFSLPRSNRTSCGQSIWKSEKESGTAGGLGQSQGGPAKELKLSPIAAIPHKSKAYRSILDLLFCLHLKNGGEGC
jgi:hypothetical protein